MLYGIRSDEQRRLAKAGYRVRDLIAYGEAWYPWYMRRLAERPANVCLRASASCCPGQEADDVHHAGPRVARMSTIGTETAFEVVGAGAGARGHRGSSIVHLQIGEPDFDTPANVREAAKRRLDEGAAHYAPFAGLPDPARGDRRGRRTPQGLRRRTRRRSSSPSAARA